MKKSWFAAAVCAAAVAGLGASAALAGEVKGPPTGGSAADPTTVTAAPAHANSACAFSGLNDYINGPKINKTQTPADGPPGAAGHGLGVGSDFPIGCRGGSNPENPPTP